MNKKQMSKKMDTFNKLKKKYKKKNIFINIIIYNLIIQNIYSFYFINNKYHRFCHTNINDENKEKTTDLNLRRKTYFNFKSTKHNEYLVDGDDEIDDKIKRFTTNK